MNQINKFDKFFLVYLLIFVILLIFLSLFSIKPLWLDASIVYYIYRLPLTLIATIVILRFHIMNILFLWFRNFINRLFGFLNPVALWFTFQLLLLIIYINISEIVWLVRINLSQTLSINNGYYFILWWIILWLVFQTIKLFKINKNSDLQGQIINIHNTKKSPKQETESFKNLFDEQ